jgi:hypothetical protein
MCNKLRRRGNPRESIRTLAGLPELRGADVARQWGATAGLSLKFRFGEARNETGCWCARQGACTWGLKSPAHPVRRSASRGQGQASRS